MSAIRTNLSRIFTALLLTAATVTVVSSSAFAQDSGRPAFAGHWGAAGSGRGGAWGHRGMAKVVTGEPYSAQAITSTVNTLPNGTNITRKITAQIARDNEGRTMRSQNWNGFGSAAGAQSGGVIVSIFDPVANQRIEYNTATKIARIFNLPPKTNEEGGAEGQAWQGKHPHPGRGEAQTESLGTQPIAGVSAEGTRTTRTIPAGAIGNDKPIVSTDERWYSAELQIVLQSTRNDPRIGQTSYIVSNLQRGEPSASLFQVPSGYQTKTVDVPAHDGGH